MRRILLSLVLVCFFSAPRLLAVNSNPAPNISETALHPSITIGDFLSIDVKQYRSSDGKKLKWTQRIALGWYQKNLAKKVRTGKMDASQPLLTDETASRGQKFGLLSVIFAVLGIAFLFIPNAIGLLGLGFTIAGLILGILGLKRDADPLLSVIGVVLSGLVLLIYIIAVIAVASVF